MKTLSTALIAGTLVVFSLGMVSPALAEHGKGMHHGGGWKASLTDEQHTKIARLKLDYKKKKYPIKAKLKQAKIEFALLITADKPNQGAINKKIEQIAKLKKEKMRLKANHKIAVRKLLDENQRVEFDMKILRKAYHGKSHGSSHGHRGHH